MNALVVGGCGFIGSHLVGRLVEGGHTVRVYDRSPNRFIGVPDGVEFVEMKLGSHRLVKSVTETKSLRQ